MRDWLIDIGIAILIVMAIVGIFWTMIVFRVFTIFMGIVMGLILFSMLVFDVHLFRQK